MTIVKIFISLIAVGFAAAFLFHILEEHRPPPSALDQNISGSIKSSEWDFSLENNGLASLEFVDGKKRDGEGVFKVHISRIGGQNFWDIQLVNPKLVVKPGVKHRVTLRAKGSLGSRLNIGAETPNYKPIIYLNDRLSTEWQLFSLEFTPSVSEIRVPIHLSFNTNLGATIYIGDMYVDTVEDGGEGIATSLSVAQAHASNVFSFDSPLEEGKDPWEWQSLVSGRNNRAQFGLVADGVAKKSQALEVKIMELANTGNPWEIQLLQEEVSVFPNALYSYSSWVNGTAGAEVIFRVEGPEYFALAGQRVTLTGEWQKVVFEFQSEYPTVRLPIHLGSSANLNATILLDNVRIDLKE